LTPSTWQHKALTPSTWQHKALTPSTWQHKTLTPSTWQHNGLTPSTWQHKGLTPSTWQHKEVSSIPGNIKRCHQYLATLTFKEAAHFHRFLLKIAQNFNVLLVMPGI
jgi:hypothetical protein